MEADFAVPTAEIERWQEGPWVYHADDAVFQLTGPGTIDCLQGVLTNDIEKPGVHGLVWGALLTAKGMIITDAWVWRDGASAWLIVPRVARDTTRQLLARSFPPRLTRVVDRTDDVIVHWLVTSSDAALEPWPHRRPHELAPFSALAMTTGPAEAGELDQRLRTEGWQVADAGWAAARKVVLQWPTLGREIDERTLVQEVRFDELHGVKYDKGCYTGQETVARLHFRGHANKAIERLDLPAAPLSADVERDGKLAGRITTWGRVGDDIVALAMMKARKTET